MQQFPGARVKKLIANEEGEFYEASRGGKVIGRAALFRVQDANANRFRLDGELGVRFEVRSKIAQHRLLPAFANTLASQLRGIQGLTN